jgi:Uncharacterised nucleotidyltransferase
VLTDPMAVLRVLLDDPTCDPDHMDWALAREIADRAGVIVRLADTIQQRGEELPPRFAECAAAACARAQRVVEIVDLLGMSCRRLGIRHAFLKTAERYPDTGRDIDLLIAAPAGEIDAAILRVLPAAPKRSSWRNRLAGSRTYAAAHGIVIDIRHGRLGLLGEHARYARLLLERASLAPLGTSICLAPSPEDNLLLIATQQVFTRPRLRLSDVFWTVRTLQRRALNWDYVFATALSMGMVAAVGMYLQYIEGIHQRLYDRPLLDPVVLARFESARPGNETRFPNPRAAARLYLQQFGATLESGRWHSAARLSLLPVVAAAALAGRGGSRRMR